MSSIKHSFNLGDLITILPALQSCYEANGEKFTIYQVLNFPAVYYDAATHPTQFNGDDVCMNEEMFNMMKPLMEGQDCIDSFEVWEGQEVRYDLDKTRDRKMIPMPFADIHFWPTFVFPELSPDFFSASLYVDYKKYSAYSYRGKIIINITERYRNPYISYFFLKKHELDVVFAGTEKEHKLFCETFKLNVPLLVVKDFLELAVYINNCKFFIGNQSLCWHIADKLQKPRVLEFCAPFPNTFPTSSNGYVFANQESLQYYFNQLISV